MKYDNLKTYSLTAAAIVAVAVCVGFLSCASASFVVSEPRSIPKDFFGVTPAGSPLTKEDAELLDDFNAVWIRTTIRWTGVEPEEGKWVFDTWDEYVAKAEAAGKKPVLVLGFDSRWLYSDNKEHRDLTEREIPYFLKYVEQVVGRYRNRIVYEIWNEPNWVFWKGSDEHFFALSAAAAKKIREIDPTATILAGSTSRVSKKFTRGMFKAGAMENTDGFAVHPYATSPVGTVQQIEKLQKILDEFGYDKPTWVTEVGFSTGPISFCSIKRYPEYIVKTLSGMATRADIVRNLIWFELKDDYNPEDAKGRLHPINYFGLVYPNRTDKHGAEAFRLTARYLAGSEHRPELPTRENVPNGITSLYFKKDDGTSILILWKNGLGKKKLRLAVSGAANLSRHNIHAKETTPLTEESLLEISRDPVFITWTGGAPPRLMKK